MIVFAGHLGRRRDGLRISAMSLALAVSPDPNPGPGDPGPWILFAGALRGKKIESLSFAPLEIALALSGAVAFGAILDVSRSAQLVLIAASIAALAGAFLHVCAELGDPWPTRLFLTVGRRPYAADELLDILRKAPTPEMRAKVKAIVVDHPVVRLRHMLPLRLEAERMARRLEQAKRDSAAARAREAILEAEP